VSIVRQREGEKRTRECLNVLSLLSSEVQHHKSETGDKARREERAEWMMMVVRGIDHVLLQPLSDP
jgi:hypothetical protein